MRKGFTEPGRAAAGWRGVIVALGLVLLAGCGFEPLYGEESAAADPGVVEALRHVAVPPITDAYEGESADVPAHAARLGQLVRIELTNRLARRGPAPKPRYRLEVKVTESRQSLAVRKDASATRANLVIEAAYDLVPMEEGGLRAAGSVTSYNSYDILDNDFATLSAEADARRRAARDIATAIIDRLAIRFREARTAGAS